MNVEQVLMPEQLKITGNVEEGLKTSFLDAELDTFEVEFNYDNCATIKTNGMAYIALSREKLLKLAHLVEVSEEIYEEEQ